MIKGLVLKAVGGKYDVKTKKGLFNCELRGVVKKKDKRPIVGDFVKIDVINQENNKGMIKKILSRKSKLDRPLVSNVNQAVIVFAMKNPDPNFQLLDRLLVLSHYNNLAPIICFNKTDLVDLKEINKYKKIYEKIGYDVVLTSTKDLEGIKDLKEKLKDNISVFAGPSGVGKSSILNCLDNNLNLRTGEISKKVKKGKHTTRHTRLLKLNKGGWVVDTPGFENLNLPKIDHYHLQDYFPEIKKNKYGCKFNDCLHINEPKCRILNLVKKKEISKQRYNSYVYILNELQNYRRY
ncbi:MAG: ribosome small subunit-dependent GTPase A [Bacillota bacterium]